MDNIDFYLLNPIYRLKKLLTNRTYISTNLREQIEIESKWVSKIRTIFEHGNRTDNSFSSKVKAKRSHRLTSAEKEAFYVLSALLHCVRIGIVHWDNLSHVQKIQLQEYYTNKLIEFLDFGNSYVNRSLPYRLREKEPEEEEEHEESY